MYLNVIIFSVKTKIDIIIFFLRRRIQKLPIAILYILSQGIFDKIS